MTQREDFLRGQTRRSAAQRSIAVSIPGGRRTVPAQLDLDTVRILHIQRHAIAIVGSTVEADTVIQRPPSRGDEVVEVWEQDGVMQKTRAVLGRRLSSFAHRAVECEMVVIAAGRHEDEPRPPHSDLVAKDVSVEDFAFRKVGNLQVDVSDPGGRVNVLGHKCVSLPKRWGHHVCAPTIARTRNREERKR